MRRSVHFLLFFFSLAIFGIANADDNLPRFGKTAFNEAQFNALQEKGIPVMVDIYAEWCPTCARQQIILDDYFESHPESPVIVMSVDFDKDKDWVKHFKAPRQSTLYIYHEGKQIWYSVAPTSRKLIHGELDKAASLVLKEAE